MCTLRCSRPVFGRRSVTSTLILAVATLGAGCEIDPAEFRFGEQLSAVQFNLFDIDMGVFPSEVVLNDPNNVFAESAPSVDAKFAILGDASTPAAFYAWATLLAIQPTGEHQFHTAQLLEVLAESGQVDEVDRPVVRDMAIRGYQAVLDFFPSDVSFIDEGGTNFFRVVTPSYFGIIRLGGVPLGNWVVVETPNGEEVLPGGLPVDPPARPEPEEEEMGG